MFREMKFVPTTETSKPFVGAKDRCGFDKLGYVEDEYFLSGTANVYDEDPEHKVHAVCENAPYTTRVMIRRHQKVVNAKSMLGLLSLDADEQNEMFLVCDGADEEAASAAVLPFFEA